MVSEHLLKFKQITDKYFIINLLNEVSDIQLHTLQNKTKIVTITIYNKSLF